MDHAAAFLAEPRSCTVVQCCGTFAVVRAPTAEFSLFSTWTGPGGKPISYLDEATQAQTTVQVGSGQEGALLACSPQCGRFALAVCCCWHDGTVLTWHAVLCCALVKLQLFRLWFSHPSVKGIIMWGWWDGNIWISNAGIYRADKTPKQAALAIRELWDNELSTRLHVEQPQTDGVSGWTPFKGFFGVYLYSYTTADGIVVQGTVQLSRDQLRQSLVQQAV